MVRLQTAQTNPPSEGYFLLLCFETDLSTPQSLHVLNLT